MGVQLTELIVGDEPDAWSRGGFDVRGDETWIGSVRIRLAGERAGRGLRSWGFDEIERSELDGLVTHRAVPAEPPPVGHTNGVTAFDHLVVTSPDLDRTLDAFTDLGLELRRTREVGTPERPRRQLFFWLGEPILELVGPADPRGDGPARFFGVACTVDDLDATADHLADACGRVKDAVQPGRRIATLRHEPLGMSVPVAFMSAHVRPEDTP